MRFINLSKCRLFPFYNKPKLDIDNAIVTWSDYDTATPQNKWIFSDS